MLRLRSPAITMLVAAHLAVASALLSLFALWWFPDLGVRFAPSGEPAAVRLIDAQRTHLAVLSPDQKVVFRQSGRAVSFTVDELRPLFLPVGDPEALADWYGRRTEVARMASLGPVRLETQVGDRSIVMRLEPKRSLDGRLNVELWALLAAGILPMLIAAWLWALRPKDWAARCYAVSALGLMISAHSAAVYEAKSLAVEGVFLWLTTVLNYLGSQVGFWATTAMFMMFPKPVLRPRLWHLLAPALVVLGAAAGTTFFNMRLVFWSILMAFCATALFIALQGWASRNDPAARSVLRWFGLTVLLGATVGVAVMVLPRLGGGPAVVQNGFALVPIVITYGGVAIGVGRFKLFDLDRWAYRVLAVATAAIVLIWVDVALIVMLNLQPGAALSFSVAAMAALYLPLRGALWRMMAGKVTPIDSALFQEAAEVAFTPDPEARRRAWRVMLERLFQPLEVQSAPPDTSAPAVLADGLELTVPPVSGEGALLLRYAGEGRQLFHSEHVALVRQLTAFMEKAEATGDAYRRGVMAERRRIAQDLHDDVGARLLSSLHRPDVEGVRGDVRGAISDIRAILADLTGEEVTLQRLLAELRGETAQRLEAAGVELDWPLPTMLPDRAVGQALYRNLRSAFREIISNVLRHAQARRVTVRLQCTGQQLRFVVSDDGVGLAVRNTGARRGLGMESMRQRLEHIGGRLDLSSGQFGTRLEIEAPLPA